MLGGFIIQSEYKVGMYIRLSREDENKIENSESESIINQRSFILDYLKENNYVLCEEYVDDGYSGTTFDRPSFNKMIKDIELGKINMVVTKDMSRLGRDYINFGHYIETWFPEHNVRYVAISDDVDTFVDSVCNDMIPFKSIFNDMYAKDISKKIKASIITRKKSGLFLGAYAPYGYIKNPNNKYELLVDPYSSNIVKRIYRMFINGSSVKSIARVLTNENVMKPSVYKSMKYKNSSRFWDESTILNILKNPNYTGNLYQNRRKKINYKSKKIINVPMKNWLVACNTHEAIISLETYELVSQIHSKNKLSHKTSNRDILLKGFIYCKECGHSIGINNSRDNRRHYTVCNYYRKHSKENVCSTHSMRYELLEDLVLNDVRRIYKEGVDKSKLEIIACENDVNNIKLDDINSRIFMEKKDIISKNNYLNISYMDKLSGLINEFMYKEISNKLYLEIKSSKNIIKELLKKSKEIKSSKLNNRSNVKDSINKFLFIDKPSRILLSSIIDKVVIDNNKNVEIFYNIRNTF
ncbi:MAG: recombinase family protein [Bacilli bacterium]